MANTFLEDRVLRALDNLSALNTLANPQEPNYWEKLLHQYTGQFMQAMISSSNYIDVSEEAMADASLRIAHALVEKLKSESK